MDTITAYMWVATMLLESAKQIYPSSKLDARTQFDKAKEFIDYVDANLPKFESGANAPTSNPF